MKIAVKALGEQLADAGTSCRLIIEFVVFKLTDCANLSVETTLLQDL